MNLITFRRRSAVVTALAVAVSLAAAHGASSDDVPWQLLPRAASLTGDQRQALTKALAAKQGYGRCKETVLTCLNQAPPDQIAVGLADFCAYLASKDLPVEDIEKFIEEREKFAKPTKTYNLLTDGRPAYGAPAAPLTIVEFAEFKCPYCQAQVPTFKKLVDESGGAVRHVFKYYPLKSHKGSVLASKAAEAAHRQGQFWAMYRLLFNDRDRQAMDDILRYAESLELDMAQFRRDLDDASLLESIENEKIEGVRAGVRGTPTLFINGKRYVFRLDEAFLRNILNEEALRMGRPAPFEGS